MNLRAAALMQNGWKRIVLAPSLSLVMTRRLKRSARDDINLEMALSQAALSYGEAGRKTIENSLREPDEFGQVAKPWVKPQALKPRIDFEVNKRTDPFPIGFFQVVKSALLISQAGIDHRDGVWGDKALAREIL